MKRKKRKVEKQTAVNAHGGRHSPQQTGGQPGHVHLANTTTGHENRERTCLKRLLFT